MVSALFDIAAFLHPHGRKAADFRSTGRWLLLLGAAGAFAATISGLALSKWVVMGTGTLLQHHLLVWPAFVLIVGLAAWRMVIGDHASRLASGVYLALMGVTCGLISAAGFYGGEMLLGK
jgi:uncharacterized membrane protein